MSISQIITQFDIYTCYLFLISPDSKVKKYYITYSVPHKNLLLQYFETEFYFPNFFPWVCDTYLQEEAIKCRILWYKKIRQVLLTFWKSPIYTITIFYSLLLINITSSNYWYSCLIVSPHGVLQAIPHEDHLPQWNTFGMLGVIDCHLLTKNDIINQV